MSNNIILLTIYYFYYRALEAPSHEKILRGRNLYTSPADSWHQPVEDADGRVCWKPRFSRTNVRSRSRSKDLDEGIILLLASQNKFKIQFFNYL